MKRFRVFLFSLFFTTPLFAGNEGDVGPQNAQDPVNFSISDLGSGLYTYPSANEIPNNAASYIQNFFTDIQPLAVERNGTVQEEATVLGGTKAVTGLWTFTDVNGIEWLIAFSSQTFYKKQFGVNFSTFGPQTSSPNPVFATTNLGKIWFVDGVSSLWWFDGTSTGAVASAPIGKLITSWRNRVAIGNINGSQSQVQFSKDGDGLTWAIGPGDSDPFTIAVGGANDGYPINCLYGMFQDNLIIGRKFDMWATYGFTQSDEQTRKITSEIGCLQNGSMRETDGDLMWLSNRGIERMNAASIQLVSDPIRDMTDLVVKNTGNSRSNLQDTATDWQAGTADNSYYIDSLSFPGDVGLTFPDYFINFRDGTNGTKNVWKNYCYGDVGVSCSTNAFVSNNVLSIGSDASLDQVVRTSGQTVPYAQGTTFYFLIPAITGNTTPGREVFAVIFSSIATSSMNPTDLNNYFSFVFRSTTVVPATSIFLNAVGDSADLGVCNNCPTGDVAVYPNGVTVAILLTTTTFSVSLNGTQVSHGTHTFPNYPLYTYLDYFYGDEPPGNIYISSFSIVPETATYTSQLLNIGTLISKWGPVFPTDTKVGGGSITYQFGSTSTASVGAIVNYASVSNGVPPGVPINPYAAFKATFKNSNPNDTADLGRFLTTWTEGSSPVNTAFTWDRRYWLSFTTNTLTNPTLDTVLVYQRNKTWTLLKGINAASFARWKDGLYYGDSMANGLVYNYDTGNSDNGNAITSVITTKSYDMDRAFRDKDFRKMYTGYQGSFAFTGTINMTYDVERSGNNFPLGSANLSDFNGLNEAKFPFPLNSSPTQGREVQYTLTKSGIGDRLKLYEFRTMFYLKEAR